MANFFTSTTPLPPSVYIQSLEKLAAKIHFYHFQLHLINFLLQLTKIAVIRL